MTDICHTAFRPDDRLYCRLYGLVETLSVCTQYSGYTTVEYSNENDRAGRETVVGGAVCAQCGRRDVNQSEFQCEELFRTRYAELHNRIPNGMPQKPRVGVH